MMVDEKTSTRALTGPRRMHKSFQPFAGGWNDPDAKYIPDQMSSGQWLVASNNCHYIEDYFDIDGYTRDMLTVIPMTIYCQEAGRYNMTYPSTSRMICIDLVTTERINDVQGWAVQFESFNNMNGFPNTNVDWTQVQYGRVREFIGVTQPTALGQQTVQDVFTPTMDQQFGSLEPTTNSKLWIYKILINQGLPGDTASYMMFPSSRIVMEVDVVKEAELPFMMRQKRSYELSNY